MPNRSNGLREIPQLCARGKEIVPCARRINIGRKAFPLTRIYLLNGHGDIVKYPKFRGAPAPEISAAALAATGTLIAALSLKVPGRLCVPTHRR
jgi:hypothetical protein